jgi:hypothetical protein
MRAGAHRFRAAEPFVFEVFSFRHIVPRTRFNAASRHSFLSRVVRESPRGHDAPSLLWVF